MTIERTPAFSAAAFGVSAVLWSCATFCAGGSAAADESAAGPLGQFVTIRNPVTDGQVAEISNLAVRLQAQALREDRDAVLVLEIEPGATRFGQVRDIVTRLTSADASRVRTVAWLPKTVTGTHAILALGCHDIVMAPDTALGDISRGEPLTEDEHAFVMNLVGRRRNSRLSPGIAETMLNPSAQLLSVSMETAGGLTEQRFITARELQSQVERGVIISDTRTIKEPGVAGLYVAEDALESGFMVAEIARNRREVAAMYDLAVESLRETAGGDQAPVARLIELHDMITPVTAEFIVRSIRTAVADGATVLIFDIDSPGGYLISSEEIATAIADLDPAEVTTVAWVRREAISGAAISAMGCDRIVLHPDAKIGDAGVIQNTPDGQAFERAPEKIVSSLLATMEALAKRKQRAPALLKAMVDRNLEVYEVTHPDTGEVTWMSDAEIENSAVEWIRGPLVPESAQELLLTVTGERAHELGLADAPCNDLNELRNRLGIPEGDALQPMAATWVDTFVYILNSWAGGTALIFFGIMFIYLELHLPSGMFGILSAVMFGLFFWARFLGGTAGALELLLFLGGMGLLMAELFVVPGFGVFGVSGILMLIASLVMASDTYSGLSTGESFQRSMSGLATVGGAFVTVIITAVAINRFLPGIPFLNKMILSPPGIAEVDPNAPRLNPALRHSNSAGDDIVFNGAVGRTTSVLRPAGKARFGDRFVDVVSDGAFIEPETDVKVVQISGNRVVVRPAADDDSDLTA